MEGAERYWKVRQQNGIAAIHTAGNGRNHQCGKNRAIFVKYKKKGGAQESYDKES